MSIKPTWVPLSVSYYKDPCVKDSGPLGRLLWPYILTMFQSSMGVLSESEIDAYEIVRSLGLLDMAMELVEGFTGEKVDKVQKVELMEILERMVGEAIKEYQKPKHGRPYALLAAGSRTYDVGGRSKGGGYGGNMRVQIGLVLRRWNAWSGAHLRTEVMLEDELMEAEAVQQMQSSPDHGPQPGHDGDVEQLVKKIVTQKWPDAQLSPSWWRNHMGTLRLCPAQQLSELCDECLAKGAGHPSYLVKTMASRHHNGTLLEQRHPSKPPPMPHQRRAPQGGAKSGLSGGGYSPQVSRDAWGSE